MWPVSWRRFRRRSRTPMASSSDRRSGSSGRSTERQRVHVGTGTRSRKATESHHLPLEADGARRSGSPKVQDKAQKRRSKKKADAERRRSAQSRMTDESRLKREEREQRRADARRTQ